MMMLILYCIRYWSVCLHTNVRLLDTYRVCAGVQRGKWVANGTRERCFYSQLLIQCSTKEPRKGLFCIDVYQPWGLAEIKECGIFNLANPFFGSFRELPAEEEKRMGTGRRHKPQEIEYLTL